MYFLLYILSYETKYFHNVILKWFKFF